MSLDHDPASAHLATTEDRAAYRDYAQPGLDRVRNFYRTNHHHQTVDFVTAKRAKWLQFNQREMNPRDALDTYPRITNLAAAQRTQRRVPSSITSWRLRIAAALLRTLPRCPCSLRVNARLFFNPIRLASLRIAGTHCPALTTPNRSPNHDPTHRHHSR